MKIKTLPLVAILLTCTSVGAFGAAGASSEAGSKLKQMAEARCDTLKSQGVIDDQPSTLNNPLVALEEDCDFSIDLPGVPNMGFDWSKFSACKLLTEGAQKAEDALSGQLDKAIGNISEQFGGLADGLIDSKLGETAGMSRNGGVISGGAPSKYSGGKTSAGNRRSMDSDSHTELFDAFR